MYSVKTLALIIFIIMYVLMIALPSKRVFTVAASAVLFVVFGVVPLREVPAGVNWNVLLMLTGTMITVYYFIESGMPAYLADVIMAKSKNIAAVTIYMSVFAGIVSAFIDNVATVLMIAPVALAICMKLSVSPVPMLIAISVSSNLQGAATLVGDTTSILLGGYAKMDFLDFFFMNGRPGIFFAVELGALATVFIMKYLFRKDKGAVETKTPEKVDDYIPTIMLVGIVIALIVASFFKDKPEVTNGLICMAIALLTVAADYGQTRKMQNVVKALRTVDIETLLLLACLFVVIEGIENTGILRDIAGLITGLGKNPFLVYSVIVWGSVLISAFVDNIPYVATMLPVVTAVAGNLGLSPYLLYFGLLCGATLGGNLTPVGASANIATLGILKKEGYNVSFKEFIRIGAPMTLTAVFVGYMFIWVFWR